MNKNPFEIDYEKLYDFAEINKNKYLHTKPFPHIIIDNFLSPIAYSKISKAFPKKNDSIWKTPSNKHTVGKSVTQSGKLGIKELLYTEAARRFFFEFNSGLFLTFLEKLTSIEGLTSDPYFSEGGFHRISTGGFLNIHADFSHSDKLNLERRLNIIFYLNDNWEDYYGGDLGLYDKNLNEVVSIKPLANRIAIFSTSDHSFHGHPEPLRCPKGMFRKSIALYYYTAPTDSRKKSRILFPTDPNFTPIISKI